MESFKKETHSTIPLCENEVENIEIKEVGESENVEISVEVSDERVQWGSKMDFMLSCVGYAVGLGNVWRFPYLCYANGGASFLIPYFLALAVNGVPLFFAELSLGQYFSLGTIGSWTAICPIARGIGFAQIMVTFLVGIYYNVIIAWCILFLFKSMRADVPWKTCGNSWNTEFCRKKRFLGVNETVNCTALGLSANCNPNWKSPSEEYFNNEILQISDSIEDVGGFNWQVTLSLLGAWALVYLCCVKGVKSSGKVVYFTATFPFLVLIILFFRGVTLEGAGEGVLFYIKPEFNKLLNAEVWVKAATQIYYSLGIGFGTLLTFGSYLPFHNNCKRDALVVALINCGTSFFAGFVIFSVVGYMAFFLETSVDKVADSGPGLAFVVYPEAISQMPVSTLWAILFFFMLITLGLDSQFAGVECVVTSLSDEYPKYLRKYKALFLVANVVVYILLALPMCTEAGMYVFNLFDYQTGGISLLVLVFFESICIGWGIGTERFSDMIETMTGQRPGKFYLICWKYITPLFTICVIISQLAMWQGVSYNKQFYPAWAEFVGWVLAFTSMLLIPIFAITQYYYAEGNTVVEKLRKIVNPDPEMFRIVAEKHNIGPKKLVI